MNVEDGEPIRKRQRRCATPRLLVLLVTFGALASAACTPTIQVAPPKEPITINLNIKLDADVRLRIEEKAKQDVEQKPIF